eukprot:m.338951 g.338951  ORF g.338951 m.338951 type:complete len:500 (+) comp18607_c0_seq1:92-1591(+)
MATKLAGKAAFKKALSMVRGDSDRVLELAPVDQEAEQEVNVMRNSYIQFSKGLEEMYPNVSDEQRLLKKIPQHVLGTKLMAHTESTQDHEQHPFELLFAKCARVQLDLGQLQAFCHHSVRNKVIAKVQGVSETLSVAATKRKTVVSATSDVESTRKKLEAATLKGNKDKQDQLQDSYESSVTSLKAAHGAYSLALANAIHDDKAMAEPLVDLLQEQLAYHKSAIQLIEAALPSVKDQFNKLGKSVGAFGCPVPEDKVPDVLQQCCAVINRDGLDTEGIFRLAGSQSKIRNLRAAINNNTADFTSIEGYEYDIHAVAALIKLYFRELPEPLLCSKYYDEWINAAFMEDNDERLQEMKRLLELLPPGNQKTMNYISKFMANVAKHDNKMETKNLGIVIGPNLLWASGGHAGEAVGDSHPLSVLFEIFMIYEDWFFQENPGADPLTTIVPNAKPKSRPPSMTLPPPKPTNKPNEAWTKPPPPRGQKPPPPPKTAAKPAPPPR